MPIEITMPALSPTMTEGVLAKWLKHEGDAVKAGDAVAEIETDKATMEVEAVDEGVLAKILVPEGTGSVGVGTAIALLLADGEEASSLDASAKPAASRKPEVRSSAAAEPSPPAKAEAVPSPAAASPPASKTRVFASPLARRLAAETGIALDTLIGSGPHGRIVKADIEAAGKSGPAARRPDQATPSQPSSPPPAPVAAPGRDQVVRLAGDLPYAFIPHSTMRRIIARRLTEAKQTIPHFYLTIDCEIDRLLAARTAINASAGDRFKVSVNDFVIRAAAQALRAVPAANASYSEEGILRWDRVDIAVAVALDDGLITPIITAADTKGLGQIATEMKDLATRARAGKLKPAEFQGGTFSISNLGMYGIREFAAVINPPHGAILAVGAGEQRPVVRDGALAVATVMGCTLSVDHRVIDGAVGAEFLKSFKRFIEEPLIMLA